MKAVSPVVLGMKVEEVIFAKDQPEYLRLPAALVDGGHRIITRWNLSLTERLRILFFGNLWLSVLTYGRPLQPVLLETENPARYIHMLPDETSSPVQVSKV